ncbi:hypothetical protein, partial [Salmonella enterica]|uniref:hypothetical protein n=1 Tax=Salmonella enterica TaxID=28901 RepID=UPI001A7E19EA
SLKTSIKTITYLSDIGCLEIQGASLKSVDSLLCGETKIGERIPQTITIAMVNLTRKNMVNIVNLHDKRERGNKDGNKRLN